MKKSIFTLLLAVAMVFSVMAVATSAEVTGLTGTGAETDPYLISNLDELKWFRDDVNAGNNYSGKYIQLTADIDLGSAEWTPIGNNTNRFKGYFDGNNKTISNLKITGSNRYVGLFGYIGGPGMSATTIPSVKNLTLTNVDVNGDWYVGGLSGQCYTTNITNVSVSGKVNGVRYVGGLVGHVYTYFKDCSFTGTATCSFDALGGIAGAGDCRAYDCTVVGTVSGSNWVGGIVGNGQEGTSAVGCYVKATVSSDTNYYFGVGGIAGVAGHGYGSTVFKDNYFDGEVYIEGEKSNAVLAGFVNADSNDDIDGTFEGNSFNTEYYPVDTPIIITADIPQTGTQEDWAASPNEELTQPRDNNLVVLESDLQYVDAENATDVTIKSFPGVTPEITPADVETAVINNAAALIGSVPYATLQAAFDAAQATDTVVLNKNLELDTTVNVPAGKTVVFDLNGKTITGTDKITASFGLIQINPGADLTVNDTVGGGKITLVAENNRGWNAFSSVISNQRGKLTVNGGTIEHLGGTDMAYGIDNLTNGKGTYAETVINGGTVKSTYRAIRQFLNGTEAQNILTVNGGTIEGANKSIWAQDANTYANSGTTTVGSNAAIIGDVYLTVTAGSAEWDVDVSIAAAALVDADVLTTNVPAGYELELENGYYGVGYAPVLDGEFADIDSIILCGDEYTVEFTDYVVANADVTVNGTVVDITSGSYTFVPGEYTVVLTHKTYGDEVGRFTVSLQAKHSLVREWNNYAHWFKCTHCGEVVDVANHGWMEAGVIKAATETETGLFRYVCICGGYKDVVIPVLGHEHVAGEEWLHDDIAHWNECACGELMNVAAHTWNDGVIEGEVVTYTCTVCGAQTEEEAPHVHVAGTEFKYNDETHWNECECGEKLNEANHLWVTDKVENGTIYSKCVLCDATAETPEQTDSYDDESVSYLLPALAISVITVAFAVVAAKRKFN